LGKLPLDKITARIHNTFDFVVYAFGIGGLGCNPRYKQRYMIAKSVAVG
jgi:hypothetical protein